MRTPVYILSPTTTYSPTGTPKTEYHNVFGDGAAVWCKWINAHGNDVIASLQFGHKELATLTLRYTPLLDVTCVIRRCDEPDGKPQFSVISVDDVYDKNQWMEITVERLVKAV